MTSTIYGIYYRFWRVLIRGLLPVVGLLSLSSRAARSVEGCRALYSSLSASCAVEGLQYPVLLSLLALMLLRRPSLSSSSAARSVEGCRTLYSSFSASCAVEGSQYSVRPSLRALMLVRRPSSSFSLLVPYVVTSAIAYSTYILLRHL